MTDQRLSKAADPARTSRAMEDRAVTENRELTVAERIAEFRKQNIQSALPDIPTIPGYHVCWLTTTSQYDTLQIRVSKYGYEPLRPEDVPGWVYNNVKSSAFPDWPISCNEMVAAKLPLEMYEAVMQELHHDQPLSEEEKLGETARLIAEQAAQKGAGVEIQEGLKGLGAHVRAPRMWG
ncbi:hypothetical protein UFOVP1204_8 [uncultured Caudovirales phage]|uniref:Uncharacterized protein n=1 Tax=uncultured Caudovirales phage TaxID=2100421 RepID=A0A6J5Q4A9_9CAUD|nr:hypothetical protein UFOVP473_19 [uncultured Caudovirales phage]CAB4176351.1 hypothetical protein UFOVP983_19 [uncultured Caudovirales phage]CAB4189486.1 hypothetical protein UFOVP1204_8 [uncultured Caudovirales phage]